MAFSTQKDFFHVPFMNENVTLECKKACVKLKSYESSIDDRSWARDESKRSKFLSDLVTCQFPATEVGMGGVTDGSGSAGGGAVTRGSASRRDTDTAALSGGDALPPMTGGDSLLQCANVHLAEYQKMLNIKVSLEKQLETSNERLRTANKEISKIKEILSSKLDSNTTKEFYNKIQKFISAGKFTKNEENEMLQIHQKMECLNKAYEVLQAENMYLKRLIEKLSSRIKMEQIPQEPEQSTDVEFLQNEVNKLRQECKMLRAMEDDYCKLKQKAGKNTCNGCAGLSDQDAENIKTIVHERNVLREKCKSFKNMEKNIQELEDKYREANKMNGDMNGSINSQASHIRDLECEMQKMQTHYEQQMEAACFAQQCLKAQIADLKDEVVKYKCQAQKVDVLKSEVSCFRNELLKRDLMLSDYDCQYKQLMDVVNELQAMKLQCLQDNHTQTCKNQTDDLAFFTCATLDEIMKEMKKKGCLNADGNADGEGESELARLKLELEELKKDRDSMCADALKRIQELEDQNSCLEGMLNCGEEKMCKMLDKIDSLDCELNKNEKDLKQSNNELNEARKLVEDIGNMQMANQKLENAVGAINSRDDEKTIEDLRRQLEEEMAKLKKCLCLMEQRDKEMKCLKEFNKKLLKDKCDMKKLLQSKQTDEDDAIDKLKKGNDKDDHSDQDINDYDKNKGDTTYYDDGDEKVVDDRIFQSVSDRKEALDDNYLERQSSQDKVIDISKQYKDVDKPHRDKDVDKYSDKTQQDEDIDKSYQAKDIDKSYRDKDIDKSYPDEDIDKSYRDEDIDKSYRDEDIDKSYRDEDIDKSYRDKDIDKSYRDMDIDKSYRDKDIDKSYRDKDVDKSDRDKDIDKLYRDEDVDKSYRDEDIDKSHRDKDIDKPYRDKDIDKSYQDKAKTKSYQDKAKDKPYHDKEKDRDIKSIHDKDKDKKSKPDKDKIKSKDNSVIRKQPIQAQALENVTVDKRQHELQQQQQHQQQQQQLQRSPRKDTSKTIPEGKVFDEFVYKNADNLKITFNKGRCMEKELRKILDEFVQECGFCFSRLVNPKSKFYTICHKLCHSGIRALPFRELAYLHKKIFAQAEQLLPGCLLDMILKEHREDIQCALMLPPTIEGMVGGGEQKCCRCKKELCCNKSEEILEEKCSRLEKDIEIARDLLESLKTLPIGGAPPGDYGDMMIDPNDCPTYRATSPIPKVNSKQLKKLKSRILKNPEIFRKQ